MIWRSRNLGYSEEIQTSLTLSLIRLLSWNSPVLANGEKLSEHKPGDWSASATWIQKNPWKWKPLNLKEYLCGEVVSIFCLFFKIFFYTAIKHIWNCCNNQRLRNKGTYLFQRHHYYFINSSIMVKYGTIALVTQWLVAFFPFQRVIY